MAASSSAPKAARDGLRAALTHSKRLSWSLPSKVFGILNAAVITAPTEGAHDMGGVAEKEHPAMAHVIEQLSSISVGPDPNQLEFPILAQLLAQPRVHHTLVAQGVGS